MRHIKSQAKYTIYASGALAGTHDALFHALRLQYRRSCGADPFPLLLSPASWLPEAHGANTSQSLRYRIWQLMDCLNPSRNMGTGNRAPRVRWTKGHVCGYLVVRSWTDEASEATREIR